MRCAAIIPCRYASTRFPGKPLADIAGKPMMWHVYQRVLESGVAGEVVIATDDARIAEACGRLKLAMVMTGSQHLTGTDRLAEAAGKVDADIYVNVQGDEPMINPEAIAAVVAAMKAPGAEEIAATNGCAKITDVDEINCTNVVKVVTTKSGLAMSYSRLPIPFPRGVAQEYRRQLGLYSFRRDALAFFAAEKPGLVELSESVEMLRFLEADKKVLMVDVVDDSIPVDTPADLERVRTEMSARLRRA